MKHRRYCSIIAPHFPIVLVLICWFAGADVTASAQTVSLVHSFSGADGEFPRDGALAQGRDGRLYGTTQSGGSAGDGVLYKQQVVTDGNLVLHNFSGPDGAILVGGLALARDGNMYGAAGTGGGVWPGHAVQD